MELRTAQDGQPYVWHEETVLDAALGFVAKTVRSTATGPHAFIGISLNGRALGDHTFNIDNGKERVWLANTTWPQLPLEHRKAVSKEQVRLWLDTFCRELWAAWIGQLRSVEEAGDLSERPAAFLIEPYVLVEGGTLLFAPPGSGKSYLCMAMSVSLEHADTIDQEYLLWNGLVQANTTYINLERSRRSMRARLARVNMALGLRPESTLRFLHGRGRSLKDISDAIRRDIQEQGVRVIILDSISRAGQGDLNDNQTANAIIDLLNGFGVSWVAIGHPPRDSQDHAYGSIFFDAGADLVVRCRSVHQPGQDLGISLEWIKGNDVDVFPPTYYGMQFEKDGISSIYKANVWDFPDLAIGKPPTMKEQVVQYLLEVGHASATEIAARLKFNRSNMATLLTHDPDFVALTQRQGRERLYGVQA